MDTAAETFVGASNNDQGFLSFFCHCLGFGLFEDGVGRLAVVSRFGHCALGPGELCGSDDFHGLCDFLDVAD